MKTNMNKSTSSARQTRITTTTTISTTATTIAAALLVLAQLVASSHAAPPDRSIADGELNEAVIFIPGDGGSQLEAKLNKSSRVHYICSLTSDWFDIWLNIHLLAPGEFDCFSDNMKLHYNATERRSENTQGVDIRPTNYGSLDSVAYLDILNIKGTEYFEYIAAGLEKVYKLKRNQDLIGAPYDFRKAPDELEEFFQNLTTQIEQQYMIHNFKPVTLICHSMGCLNTLYLLNRKPQNWKDVMIRRVVALAAPWHGSFKAISTMMFGDDLGIPVLFRFSHRVLQDLQKTFPSLMYLFPRAPTFNEDRVLVQTPGANYTLKTLDKLFEMTNLTDQREMWHNVREIANNLRPPNVELWCLYGNQPDSTPTMLKLDKPYESFTYTEVNGHGDGTVNLESLRACESFASQQEQPVYTREFEGLDHVAILRDQKVTDFITSNIFNSSMTWNRIPVH